MDLNSYDALEITIVPNPQTLSAPDLVEEYQKLSKYYVKQKQRIDKYMQEIYTLKQDKALKDKLLNQELEEITENYDRELNITKSKHLLECEELQNRLTKARLMNENIELENQRLKTELEEKISLLQLKTNPEETKTCNDNETIVPKKRIEYFTKIESEHSDLTEEIVQVKLEKSQLMSQITQIKVIHVFG